MTRDEAIQFLVANSASWDADDFDTLSGLPDQKLGLLVNECQSLTANAQVAQLALNGFEDGDRQYRFDADRGGFVANTMGGVCDDPTEPDEDDAQNPKHKGKTEMPMTTNQWLQRPDVPDDVKRLVVNAMRVEQAEKDRLVSTLTANVALPQVKDDMIKWLSGQPVESLRNMALLTANASPQAQEERFPGLRRASYFGQQGTVEVVANSREEDDVLLPPVVNWESNGKAHA